LISSARKINANRANARASTGPKTAQGRARAARNALRHGLSLPVYSNPILAEQVEVLAREIAGKDADAEIQELARRVAEAQIDVSRARYARHQLLSRALSDRYYESPADTRAKVAVIRSLLRRNAPEVTLATLERFVSTTPEGPEKLALILSQEAKKFWAIDRYERRALFRRKSAIEAFDEAQ
jgi:hypothetical protein